MRYKNCTIHPLYLSIDGKEVYLPSEAWVTVPPKQVVLERSKFSPLPFYNAISPSKDLELPPIQPDEILIVSQEALDYAHRSSGRANQLLRANRLFAPGLKESQGAIRKDGKIIIKTLIRST